MDISDEDKQFREVLTKRKYTGHIRFIGELYMQDMIIGTVIVNCLQELVYLAEVTFGM